MHFLVLKRFFFVLVFLVVCSSSFAQLDTAFWFVAPEVTQQHGDRPIVLRFASLNNPAVITVTQPANPAFPTQTINLAANSAQTLDLTPWIDIVENKPANTVLNYGFKINSSASITAYYEVNPSCNCNPDIFPLKGKNAIGTSFMTPFQTYLNNASYARSAFNIVATQNNTTVTIFPTQNIVGHAANVPFTITLNKGQTYCAEAVSTSSALHLGGSVVLADKPVAVTLSDDTASGAPYGGCADLMGDQLIPASVIGQEYIAIKGYLNGPDKVYVLAVSNGTQVSVDGAPVTTINAGQTYEHTLSNPAAYFQASLPVYVLHMSGFGCEVAEAILPPIVCTGSNVVAFVRSTNEFIAVNLLVPTGGENSFLFNGAAGIINGASFNVVPGTGGSWKYAQINASTWLGAGQAGRIENANTKFHMGLIHGGASSGCRYGYFSDFASLSYSINVNDANLCTGETLTMVTNNLPGATYNWTGPNGFTAQGDSVSIPNVDLLDSGQYIIAGFLPGACSLISDSIDISITQVPSVPSIFTNGPVCETDSLLFWNVIPAPTTYTWTDQNGLPLAANDTLVFNNLSPGNVEVTLVANNGECLSPPATLTTSIGQLFSNDIIVSDSLLCSGEDLQLQTVTVNNASYLWTGPNGFQSTNQNPLINNIQVLQSGEYVAGGTVPGPCPFIADTVVITVIDVPDQPIILTNGPVCYGDSLLFWFNENPLLEYTWADVNNNTVLADSLIYATMDSGTYSVELVSNLGECISSPAQLSVTVFDPPLVSYGGPSEICGDEVEFTVNVAANPQDPQDTLNWFNLDGTWLGNQAPLLVNASSSPMVTDSFYVEVLTQTGCVGYDTFEVTFNPLPIAGLTWEDFCDGETIDFTNTTSWNGNPQLGDQLSYQLTYGDGTNGTLPDASHLYATTGVFNVELIANGSNGCSDTLNVPVEVLSVPVTEISIDDGCGDIVFEAVVVSGAQPDSILWNVGGLFQNNAMSFTETVNLGGTYNGMFTVYAPNDCTFDFPFDFVAIPALSFDELELPNVITPNGDGINDEWSVDPLFADCHPFVIQILNRWGNVVFEMENGSTAFQGKTEADEALLPGVYFYTFTSEEHVKHGNITIVR
jgi:gliding motility-associated-like protein